jgi:hypothetical protein
MAPTRICDADAGEERTLSATRPDAGRVQYGLLKTTDLIRSLCRKRLTRLYYSHYPANVKELIVRQNVVSDLVSAYRRGGDDLFRFNLLVILNHRGALTDAEKEAIAGTLRRAVADPSPWVRTEAAFGLGFVAGSESIPLVIPLLDDPDSNVVNEAILTLGKLAGIKDLPISNQDMPAAERKQAVEYWKGWWADQTPAPVEEQSQQGD